MAHQFFQYNPERIVAWLGSIQIVGFAEGTFMMIEYEEDAVTKSVGAQGAVTATINANRSGQATFTLVQGSPTNEQLSDIAASNRASDASLIVLPLQVQDLNGTTLCEGAEAWVMKVANTEFAKEVSNREWIISIAKLRMRTGGGVL